MESYESSFIRGQIAMIESECTQLRFSQTARPELFELYNLGLQHVRRYVNHYREAGAEPALLMRYFVAIERLDSAIQIINRHI